MRTIYEHHYLIFIDGKPMAVFVGLPDPARLSDALVSMLRMEQINEQEVPAEVFREIVKADWEWKSSAGPGEFRETAYTTLKETSLEALAIPFFRDPKPATREAGFETVAEAAGPNWAYKVERK